MMDNQERTVTVRLGEVAKRNIITIGTLVVQGGEEMGQGDVEVCVVIRGLIEKCKVSLETPTLDITERELRTIDSLATTAGVMEEVGLMSEKEEPKQEDPMVTLLRELTGTSVH